MEIQIYIEVHYLLLFHKLYTIYTTNHQPWFPTQPYKARSGNRHPAFPAACQGFIATIISRIKGHQELTIVLSSRTPYFV